MHFTIGTADYHATIYDNAFTGARIMGTIHRPYVTQANRKAVPHGDRWTVAATDGTLVLISRLQPSKARVTRALNDYYAKAAA